MKVGIEVGILLGDCVVSIKSQNVQHFQSFYHTVKTFDNSIAIVTDHLPFSQQTQCSRPFPFNPAIVYVVHQLAEPVTSGDNK